MVWRYGITLATAVALLAGLAATATAAPAFPFPVPPAQPGGTQTPPPAADPRLGQIRQGLEKRGLRVLDLYFKRTKDGDPQWWTETAASYAQPSRENVLGQLSTMWGVMYEVLSAEDPRTFLSASQLWTKYSVIFHTRLSGLSTFIRAFQEARSDTERAQAFNTFINQTVIVVYDNERQQRVDEKDFINKNFTR